MNLEKFDQRQQQALLDLLVLAMYADGHLATAEDERIEQVLTAMGFETEYDHQREFDAAVTRVRQHAINPETVRGEISRLAERFPEAAERNEVFESLNELVGTDNEVARSEINFLSLVAEVFKL
jgi:uncharacterized tellurite resistance protein B-like protein